MAVNDLDEAAYAAALLQAGLPAPVAKILADSDAQSAADWLFDDRRTLEKAIGCPTTPVERTLDEALWPRQGLSLFVVLSTFAGLTNAANVLENRGQIAV